MYVGGRVSERNAPSGYVSLAREAMEHERGRVAERGGVGEEGREARVVAREPKVMMDYEGSEGRESNSGVTEVTPQLENTTGIRRLRQTPKMNKY